MLKISIIIPVYKVEQYIIRCLESVASQNVADVDLECIIVDDCSPDCSMQLVREFVDNYHGWIHFLLLSHLQNKGLSATRNTGVEKSSGDYVFFLDSDDCITSDCIAKLTSSLVLCPNADCVMGNIYHEKDNCAYMQEGKPITIINTQKELFQGLFDMKIPNSACNRLIRHDILKKNQLLFTEKLLYEDILWNYNLFLAIHSVVIVSDVTYIYEDNQNSIVNTTVKRPNDVANSFCYISGEIVSHLSPCLKSNCLMYAFTVLLKAVDVLSRFQCEDSVITQIKDVKAQLMKTTLKSGRFVLASFFMLMYKPFCNLLLYDFIRNNYHRLSILVTRTETVFDKLLCRN